jgi:imidazolonepropionase-like amidohydrolase
MRCVYFACSVRRRSRMPVVACLIASSVFLGYAALSASAAAPPEHVALTGAKIIPVVGAPIDKGTILIERGKITAVGAQVDIPYDAKVFKLDGKVIFPGLINVHTARGMDIANEQRPVTPHLDVYDALDPSQLFFEECLRLGITAVHVIPGNYTVIGGVGRVVHPVGLTVGEMTIAEGSFLKLAVTPRGGFDRMSQMATLRETFAELDDYLERVAEQRYEAKCKEDKKDIDVGPAEARKRGRALLRAEDIDDQHRNLLRLRGGQVKVGGEAGPTLFKPLGAFVYCGNAMDVRPAVQFAKDHGFFERLVLVLGGECYKAVDELKAAGRPVVLPPELIYRETNPLTGDVKETFVPQVMHAAGLLFALLPGADDSYAERMPTYQAAQCVRAGIPRDVALKAITLNAAKLLGLDARLGSLETGKEAYLVVFSGDPLDFNSVVEQVFIAGIPAYERSKDVRIQRLLSPGTEDGPKEPKK